MTSDKNLDAMLKQKHPFQIMKGFTNDDKIEASAKMNDEFFNNRESVSFELSGNGYNRVKKTSPTKEKIDEIITLYETYAKTYQNNPATLKIINKKFITKYKQIEKEKIKEIIKEERPYKEDKKLNEIYKNISKCNIFQNDVEINKKELNKLIKLTTEYNTIKEQKDKEKEIKRKEEQIYFNKMRTYRIER